MKTKNENFDQCLIVEIDNAISSNACISAVKMASKDKIQQMCRECYGRTFKGEKTHRQVIIILDGIAAGRKSSEIIDDVYGDKAVDSSHFFRFCKVNIASFSIIHKQLGGSKMTKNAVVVLKELSGRDLRITLKQISQKTKLTDSEVREAIGELRELGIKVISSPGRSNSGYLLNDDAEQQSEDWINAIRMNRYGLDPDFKYA